MSNLQMCSEGVSACVSIKVARGEEDAELGKLVSLTT